MKQWEVKLFNSLIENTTKRNLIKVCKEIYQDDSGDTNPLLHLLARTILFKSGVKLLKKRNNEVW